MKLSMDKVGTITIQKDFSENSKWRNTMEVNVTLRTKHKIGLPYEAK